MSDEADIQRVIHDYAWACDNKDWKMLASVFTADARLDYTSNPPGPVGSRDEVVPWLAESMDALCVIQHIVTNFQIDIDGDTAHVKAMFYCTGAIDSLDEDMFLTGGYYDEDLVRTAHGWKIQRLYEDNRWMKNRAGSTLGPALRK